MEFLEIWHDPWLMAVLVAVGLVIFVNGWTDAPCAIATCVASGVMSKRRAALLAAIFNLLGIAVCTTASPAVAKTVMESVFLPYDHPDRALAVLLCALVATALLAVLAWAFGIPTSESHAMLAGLSGAAFACEGVAGLNGRAWSLILLGLALSLLGGIFAGGLGWAIVGRRCLPSQERQIKKWMTTGACAMAFVHGAQDGQKFIGFWLMATSLRAGDGTQTAASAVACALLMGTGTLLGGARIIRTLGEKLLKTGYREGFSADLGAAACLLLLTLLGIPVSTTHTKTAALMGVGAAKGRGRIDPCTVAKLLGTWILTFPACFLAGFGLMKLCLSVANSL